MQDVNFIASTIHAMTEGVQNKETLQRIIGTANEYARTMKYPASKTEWSDEQVSKYFAMIERLVELPVQYSQAEFDELTLEERLEAAGLQATDKTDGLQQPGGLIGEVVKDMQQQNKYRDDLKCPYCQAMVYDNRNSKKSDKSPVTSPDKSPDKSPHTNQIKVQCVVVLFFLLVWLLVCRSCHAFGHTSMCSAIATQLFF